MSFRPAAADEPIAIIVNAQNTIGNLNMTEVRIYWMRRPKKRWEGIDMAVKPVDMKNKCAEKTIFYSNLIKMTEDAVESYFTARQYQNGERPLVKVENENEMIDYVGKEVGAIGYVRVAALTPQALEKVKVIYTLSK
jgi:ABC-type phosphate transport system substrate-binding protein